MALLLELDPNPHKHDWLIITDFHAWCQGCGMLRTKHFWIKRPKALKTYTRVPRIFMYKYHKPRSNNETSF